jgi:hypothetical protein
VSDLEKLEQLIWEIDDLHLGREPRPYDIVSREVNLSRLPEERRGAFEADWRDARQGLESHPAATTPSPADLFEGKRGVERQQPQELTQRQGQNHGVSV